MPHHIYMVLGGLTLRQENGWTVEVQNIEQHAPNWDVHGGANAQSFRASGAVGRPRSGRGRASSSVTGTTSQNRFEMHVKWNDGKTGEYHGTFDDAGHLSGRTFDSAERGEGVKWNSDRVFRKW